MISAVLSAHMDVETCGVAKFNAALARQLCVPMLSLGSLASPALVSIHPREVETDEPFRRPYDLLLHSWEDSSRVKMWISHARRVYAANPVLARQIDQWRPGGDVVTVWCPSAVEPTSLDHRSRSILTFGMLHKFDASRYMKLRDLLEADGLPYEIMLSAAVHHGQDPGDWKGVIESFEHVFGDHWGGKGRLTVLGQLSDTALIRELPRVVAVAAFFDPAVRANNTTAWLALQWGRCLITNLDEDSPKAFEHGETVYDVNQMTFWPTDKQRIAANGREVAAQWSWESLATQFR